MDKGIRQGVNAKFNEMLPQLKELGGKKFRRTLLDWAVEQYGCTMAASSTHYNHAFQSCKKAAPELVEGLGRAEGKNNGGRKKKVIAEVPTVIAAIEFIDAQFAVDASLEALVGEAAAMEVVPDQAPAQIEAVPETIYVVRREKDEATVARVRTLEEAMELCKKAAEQKKAKLYIVQ
jgi:hypothetical protein